MLCTSLDIYLYFVKFSVHECAQRTVLLHEHISHRPSEWWSAQLTCGVAQVVVFSFPSWAAAEAAVAETGWYSGADLTLRENYSRAHSHCMRIPFLTYQHYGTCRTKTWHCAEALFKQSFGDIGPKWVTPLWIQKNCGVWKTFGTSLTRSSNYWSSIWWIFNPFDPQKGAAVSM